MINKGKLKEILDSGVKKYGSVRALSRKIGINATSIQDYIDEKTEPRGDNTEKIASFFRVSVSTFLDGKPENSQSTSTEFVQIRKIKAPLSGGGGTVIYFDELGHEYSFRLDWIKKHCPGNNCALFNVSGDSMAPEITDGDIVLVDMSQSAKNTIADGKIYAFSEGDRIFVKKLEWRGTELWAVPSNAKEYRIKKEDHFSVIGRVIWVGHEVK